VADEAEPKKGGRAAKQMVRLARTAVSMGAFECFGAMMSMMAIDTGGASTDTEGAVASALEHDIGPTTGGLG